MEMKVLFVVLKRGGVIRSGFLNECLGNKIKSIVKSARPVSEA
jgi:hypothetical protein